MSKKPLKIAFQIDQILRDIVYSFEVIAESEEIESVDSPNPLVFKESHDFESTEHYIEFLNEYCVELFGNCGPMEDDRDAIKEFNKLLQDERLEITLIGREKGKARSATLFFLSKMVCHADRIRFIASGEELNEYDVLISADPFYMEQYHLPYILKRKQKFNEECHSMVEFKKVEEILPILEKTGLLD